MNAPGMSRLILPKRQSPELGSDPNLERYVYRLLAGNHACQMSDLKFNRTKVGCFFVARGVLKGLPHPSMVAGEEAIQRFLGEADSFVGSSEVLRAEAIVVDERKHVSVDDN